MDNEPTCFVCKKKASELTEYTTECIGWKLTPAQYVIKEEGTFNRESNHFCCTACYIDIGMPSGPRGWKAP